MLNALSKNFWRWHCLSTCPPPICLFGTHSVFISINFHKSLSQLRRKGLGSSVAARSCGIWTSLRKSALLPQSEDFHSLPSSSAALNHSLQSGNPCGDARSRLFAVTDEHHEIICGAKRMIKPSLVCVSVHQDNEILALLPGTIIRSDGVVATCASRLSFLKSKGLLPTVNVKVLNGKATYVAALLDADFSLNIGFIKIMSPIQHEVARFGKLSSMFLGRDVVAVGCTSRGRGLPDADFHYHLGFVGPIGKEIKNKQSDASASGPVIYAHVEGSGSVIGGPLVNSDIGVVGVVHFEEDWQIKATPIDEVLKCLERLEKYREQDPKSDACA